MDNECVVYVAKWGPTSVSVSFTAAEHPTSTIEDLRIRLYSLTNVPPNRQKLLGLTAQGKPATDDTLLCAVRAKNNQFMLIGTAEDKTFIDPSERADLPEVLNDLDFDYSPDSLDVPVDPKHRAKLEKVISTTEVRIINPPREGKKLLVLDLDYTLFDHKGTAERAEELKRPFLDQFLTAAYENFDIVIWSQTKWTWLEMKITELGMLTNPNYRIMFVLDITSMFHVTNPAKLDSDGKPRKHQVKALEVIWAKFPQYGAHNSIHIDDLGRNFAMNPQSGLRIEAYRNYATSRATDKELLYLAQYLTLIAPLPDFRTLKHDEWKRYIQSNLHRLDSSRLFH
eukprot:GILK01009802.1.p1 GENE.GILK01009802.1~~GILK01009802.1.p1  ORF type:complete len:340 (-),score=49.87 GILK01009802.1:170-1189(-)